jgi:hypothetical protein
MNYKRAWNTLKAESGYRDCPILPDPDACLRLLMDRMEKRILAEEAKEKQ